KDYSQEDYIEQFKLKIKKLLDKLDRMEEMYKTEKDIPKFFWEVLTKQRSELNKLLKKYGKDEILPSDLS
ncbi:unnamed protein product, partial [marine sediment metagenome]